MAAAQAAAGDAKLAAEAAEHIPTNTAGDTHAGVVAHESGDVGGSGNPLAKNPYCVVAGTVADELEARVGGEGAAPGVPSSPLPGAAVPGASVQQLGTVFPAQAHRAARHYAAGSRAAPLSSGVRAMPAMLSPAAHSHAHAHMADLGRAKPVRGRGGASSPTREREREAAREIIIARQAHRTHAGGRIEQFMWDVPASPLRLTVPGSVVGQGPIYSPVLTAPRSSGLPRVIEASGDPVARRHAPLDVPPMASRLVFPVTSEEVNRELGGPTEVMAPVTHVRARGARHSLSRLQHENPR